MAATTSTCVSWLQRESFCWGRLKAVEGAKLALAPDLEENLAKGEEWLANFKKSVDDYIAKNKLDFPTDSSPRLEGSASAPILELDLRSAGITSIIWATGFSNGYDWLKLPLLDERREPVHERGITRFPGSIFSACAGFTNRNRAFYLLADLRKTRLIWRNRSQ